MIEYWCRFRGFYAKNDTRMKNVYFNETIYIIEKNINGREP